MQRALTGAPVGVGAGQQHDQLRHRVRRARLGGGGGRGAAARSCSLVVLLAQLPGAWAAVRSARISYVTRFALIDSYRRKYILANLIAERQTAAELRSFTMRAFLIGRVARLAAYARSAELTAARQQTVTKVVGERPRAGVATAGVYAVLGALLATGVLPLSVAGTAVLALRSAAGSLQQLMYTSTSATRRACTSPTTWRSARTRRRGSRAGAARPGRRSSGSSRPASPSATRARRSPPCARCRSRSAAAR